MSNSSRKITAEFIDTPEGISAFLEHIASQKANAQPFLYIDLEGTRLSRDGTISLLTCFSLLDPAVSASTSSTSRPSNTLPLPQSTAGV